MAYAAEPTRELSGGRYSSTAAAFHWVTILLVLAQAYLGFAFHSAEPGPRRMSLFTWHETVGALILVIVLARLAYRLRNPPPPYPPGLARWEQVAGNWSHRLFYALLIAMPLTGLIAVSAHAKGMTIPLIGGIPLPVIPGVSKSLGETAGGLHEAMVWILILLIVIHAAAGLKHQFDGKGAAGRMPPFKAAG